MSKLNLSPGEKIIMEAPRGVVPQDDPKAQTHYVSLVLTNKALYVQYLSIWNRAVKETKVIPLSVISIHEGKAQVGVRKVGLFQALVIYTKKETFEFVMSGTSKNEVRRWADSISKLLTGHNADMIEEGGSIYADSFRDILKAFKGSKNESKTQNDENIECTYSVEDVDNSKAALDEQIELIKNLKELLDVGALTQEEFDRKKKEILGL